MKNIAMVLFLSIFLFGCAGNRVFQASQPPPDILSLESSSVTYNGTLPCNNCENISLEINLNPSSESFSLKASYIGHPQNLPDENYQGRWTVSRGINTNRNAIVYQLKPYEKGQEYFFLRLNNDQLELISPNRERFEEGRNLRIGRLGTILPANNIVPRGSYTTPSRPAVRSSGTNCHWVSSYTRKNGTRVRGHRRCR